MVTSYTYILPSFIAELEGSQLCALSVCSGLVNHSSEGSIVPLPNAIHSKCRLCRGDISPTSHPLKSAYCRLLFRRVARKESLPLTSGSDSFRAVVLIRLLQYLPRTNMQVSSSDINTL